MRNVLNILMVLSTVALGVWMFYFLPGWVGILAGCVFLLLTVLGTVFLAFGVGARNTVARLWKEFFDFLYGL